MTSKTLKSAIWLTMVASAVAFAQGGPPPGKGKPPTEATNNLSVPAIMVVGGDTAANLGCTGTDWTVLMPPTGGEPLTGYTIDADAYYFVQKVHTWQAQCRTAEGSELVNVVGEWGDNLTGDAKLKAGSPIRVELVLTEADGATADGYTVVKLEPEKLDRLSAYGTLATPDGVGGYTATPVWLTPVVYDGQAKMVITGPDEYDVTINNMAPEINATGKVVYGYQLIAPTPGQYVITFTMPNVTFTSCDTEKATCAGNTAELPITVGGGGGRRPPRQ